MASTPNQPLRRDTRLLSEMFKIVAQTTQQVERLSADVDPDSPADASSLAHTRALLKAATRNLKGLATQAKPSTVLSGSPRTRRGLPPPRGWSG